MGVNTLQIKRKQFTVDEYEQMISAVVSVQNPICLTNSQPQPDLALLVPAVGPLYGGESIREYWLVDLVESVVEVYRGRGAGDYRSKETFAPGDVLAPEALRDIRLKVDDIVGLPLTGG